tara:strand:+ start:4016 stop:4855 length:840 start_codon:yes stop_codon:yes gene_type:complete
MANSLDKPIDKDSLPSAIKKVDVMKQDFGIDIPVESVPLPSMGIIYDKNSSLFNRETLDIRPMTAREEDILTSRAYIKNGTVLTELIKSCLVDKTIDPDDLISGDKNALLIALRATGYGTDYEAEVECPSCGFNNKSTFNLANLKIKRLEIDPINVGENLFQIELPVTKKEVKVKFLNGHDEKEMSIINERKRKSGINSNTAVTDRLARSVVEVGGITDKNKIRMFVNNMPARDSLALRRFLDKHEPGIDMKVWLSCVSCHEESEVDLPMGASFFWPES